MLNPTSSVFDTECMNMWLSGHAFMARRRPKFMPASAASIFALAATVFTIYIVCSNQFFCNYLKIAQWLKPLPNKTPTPPDVFSPDPWPFSL